MQIIVVIMRALLVLLFYLLAVSPANHQSQGMFTLTKSWNLVGVDRVMLSSKKLVDKTRHLVELSRKNVSFNTYVELVEPYSTIQLRRRLLVSHK